MSITINIFYSGENGNARKFAEEMVQSGIVKKIREEEGNESYAYYFPMEDEETVLLIDSWKDQSSLDVHHGLPVMQEIIQLREKYDLHMVVNRYVSNEAPESDAKYIKK